MSTFTQYLIINLSWSHATLSEDASGAKLPQSCDVVLAK